ncbi:hypothetical protein OAJ80_00800 [Candidatus Thioglobus sp.]|nr:hypothetical protein [Candidatus Thioglobus sp.]
MKSLKTTIIENQDYLEEGLNLRSVSGVVLVGKIQQSTKQLKTIRIVKEDGTLDPVKLQKKLDLLSDQNLYLSILTGSLQLLSKGRGRR